MSVGKSTNTSPIMVILGHCPASMDLDLENYISLLSWSCSLKPMLAEWPHKLNWSWMAYNGKSRLVSFACEASEVNRSPLARTVYCTAATNRKCAHLQRVTSVKRMRSLQHAIFTICEIKALLESSKLPRWLMTQPSALLHHMTSLI